MEYIDRFRELVPKDSPHRQTKLKDIAEKIGLHPEQVSALMKGRWPCKPEHAERFYAYLGLTDKQIGYLVRGQP